MDYKGTTTLELWKASQKIAQEQGYPIEQPPHCPYIIVKKVSENQLLAIAGCYKKGRIDVFIVEVRSPKIKPEDRKPIPDEAWEEAREVADELLSRAIEATSERCSTVK